jgi:ribosomal-protein-alanine N-acetyltransferase
MAHDPPPLSEIETPRLRLRAPDPAWAAAVADFYRVNQAHLAPWDPPRDAEFFGPATQAKRLADSAQAVDDGTQLEWWLFARDDERRVIGQLRLSQIVRGAFHNATLGYAIGAEHEGHGLMHEALQAALDHAFGPHVRLHRVQANARPENRRSLALLERLGFRREGYAPAYLFIAGAWRDHVMTALLNPHWPADAAPQAR